METKKRITKEEVEKYTEKFKIYVNMYESILERGGVNSEQFFTLIEIYDLDTITGVSMDEVIDLISKGKMNEVKRITQIAVEYVFKDKKNRINLFKKTIYLGELESDEIKKMCVGYYLSLCASVLLPVVFANVK